MASGQWVLSHAVPIAGWRPKVRVQYERVPSLDSRIIANALIDVRSKAEFLADDGQAGSESQLDE
jgi:hypothetical protein